jgi:hypothetical protein
LLDAATCIEGIDGSDTALVQRQVAELLAPFDKKIVEAEDDEAWNNWMGVMFGDNVRVTVHRDGAIQCLRLEDDSAEVRRKKFPLVRVEDYASARACAETRMESGLQAARATFLAGCRPLFEAHPGLESFGWKQYISDDPAFGPIPYSYGLGAGCLPDINGIDGHELDSGPAREEVELQRSVQEFVATFNYFDGMAMLGDGVRVTVHRDGTIDTDDYYED